jgi:two-component system phosphate regulon response regulator OmpR
MWVSPGATETSVSDTNRILIIDDDEKLTRLLSTFFRTNAFELEAATTPSAGLQALRASKPDVVILDVMLPEMNGFEVCKRIRAESQVPIIMLTAKGDVTDRVVGLELGADDYLAKPFDPRELLARIRSVLRRGREPAPAPAVWRSGPLSVDTGRREASLHGKPLALTTSEYDLLTFFLAHPGAVFDRDQLLDALKGVGVEAYSRSADVTLSRLRAKLGDDPKTPTFFKTVWGSGYMFIAAVERGPA